jgi:TPP-dependent pyruvate/acetoin dehydrogenase alpha subunit
MGKDDHVITAYRDHGHAIAVGMDTKPLMAELYGKITGCSKGKGGSMHYFAPDKNYWGGHGIVGGQVPLGTGLAYALKFQGKKGAAMAFMGDGAVNQGAVHEAYNLAALWDLPVLFVIENNRYSMGTSQERSSAGQLGKRAEAYDMKWYVCGGHDVYEVRATLDQALKRAREESKPAVVEIDTYRYRGHSVADPDKTYRDRKEIESRITAIPRTPSRFSRTSSCTKRCSPRPSSRKSMPPPAPRPSAPSSSPKPAPSPPPRISRRTSIGRPTSPNAPAKAASSSTASTELRHPRNHKS